MINAKTTNGDLPIHIAARHGQLEIFKYIIEQNSQMINAKHRDGWLPIHYAALLGRLEIIMYCIQKLKCNPYELKNKITFTPQFFKDDNLLKLILERIDPKKSKTSKKRGLDELTDANDKSLVEAFIENPQFVSLILARNYESYRDKENNIEKLILDPFQQSDNVVENLLRESLLASCHAREACTTLTSLFNNKNTEQYKNFIHNVINTYLAWKLLLGLKPIDVDKKNKELKKVKVTSSFRLPAEIANYIMEFTGYTCFDNPKNKEIINTLRTKRNR